tara:strand:- start:1976 stop:2230 length:255 start_codon:yes stop_codon:yes gene_type:complete
MPYTDPSDSIDPSDYTVDSDDDEYLTRVVVDTCCRKFWMYSNEGDVREVTADSTDEFMNILELVRHVVDDDIVAYTEPRVKSGL